MSLIAHYPMNDNAASTTVLDTTGNHNGTSARNTNSSGFTTAGKLGPAGHQALTFNGTTDGVAITGDIFGNGDVTFACWLKADSAGGAGYGRIIDNGMFLVCCGGVNTSLMIRSTSAGYLTATIPAATWCHLVVQRYAAGQHVVWLNGVPIVAGVSGTPTAGGTTYIGTGGGCSFGGPLDDVRIYNAILSSADILAIYNQGTGTELDAPAITFPSAANVWTGSGTYGWTGADITPTKVASSITNCSAANILYNVAIGDVTGTFVAPTAAQLIHGQSCGVSGGISGTQYVAGTGDVRYGVNTGVTTGTLVGCVKSDGTLYTTGIIYGSGSYVATGYYNGTDAPTAYTLYELVTAGNTRVSDAQVAQQATDAGLITAATLNINNTNTTVAFGASSAVIQSQTAYGTIYAAGQAVQLVTDKAAVDAAKANIVTGTTILTKAGSYPTTATSQAAQLAADQATVLASTPFILTGHSILLQAGTLPVGSNIKRGDILVGGATTCVITSGGGSISAMRGDTINEGVITAGA